MRFDGDWDKVLLNRCDHFGIGINRLTDGTGEDSTSFVVGRQIDVTPEDEGFIFLLRGFETFENAVFPVDGAPGNGFDAKRIDGGVQLLDLHAMRTDANYEAAIDAIATGRDGQRIGSLGDQSL